MKNNPEIFIYRNSKEIPEHFYYQAQAFVRIFWSDGDEHDIDSGLKGINSSSTHIVLAQGKSLLSYATIVQRIVGNDEYKLAGLGEVMTFPHFRKRGYAGQVVQVASDLIKNEMSADFGLLWTEPKNYNLYRRSGWELTPDLVTLYGDPANPNKYEDEAGMVLFCSDKAQQARETIASSEIYIGTSKW